MSRDSDFGAVGRWYLMSSGAESCGILVAQFSKLLAEKLKEWENSSVDDIAMGASPSPVYNPITAVVFGVIYDGGDPAET